jgi:hypothetical protein
MAPTITAGGRVLLLVSSIGASTLCAQIPASQTPASQTFQPVGATAPLPAHSLLQEPAHDAQINLSGDTLSIHAENASLSAILHQVAAKSGMQIEGLNADERVFGSFGPGAPRDVLADLLNGTAYNVVLLGDLSNGAPRQLILSPATAHPGTAPTPAPAQQANAVDDANEQEPEPQPEVQQPPTPPPGAPGVRTPQQLFEQLQRMRSQQGQTNATPDQQQQPQQPPAQQP